MHPNVALLQNFYAAFVRRDGVAMGACYAAGATFRDPVFETLQGWRIGAMWRMLCERATDLELTVSGIKGDARAGSAQWEARYTFSATGRAVHNVIDASFAFAGGRIVRHEDTFDLYRWARQALGVKGLLLGWTPPVQRAIRAQAARGLDGYVLKHALGPKSA
jgi:ketosteroid isomerase-like protein